MEPTASPVFEAHDLELHPAHRGTPLPVTSPAMDLLRAAVRDWLGRRDRTSWGLGPRHRKKHLAEAASVGRPVVDRLLAGRPISVPNYERVADVVGVRVVLVPRQSVAPSAGAASQS